MNFLLELLRGLDVSPELPTAILPTERRKAIEMNRKSVLITWSESLNAAAPEADLPTGLSSYVYQ